MLRLEENGKYTFTPDFFGIEYEIQLGVPGRDGKIHAIPLMRHGRETNAMTSADSQLSAYGISSACGQRWRTQGWCIDVGNVEVRGPKKEPDLNELITSLQPSVEIIAKDIGEGLEEFGLFLPQVVVKHLHGLACTKHLSISFEGPSKRNIRCCKVMSQRLFYRFPHYFKASLSGLALKARARNLRLHIQLPYRFCDYEGLWDGTAYLPAYEEIAACAAPAIGPDCPVTKPLWGWEATCLGWWKDGKWVEYNKLI